MIKTKFFVRIEYIIHLLTHQHVKDFRILIPDKFLQLPVEINLITVTTSKVCDP